ncbi:hypothetical protein RI103_08695 [Paraburkholderia sp. FT54]|nr:hypothetical protein [Paraburkholderia sp. FT54]WNC91785.1 hypothetical protein RI103_08695 [Paraburkholderia sp. FT54]
MEILVVVVEAGSLIAGGELVSVLEDYLREGAPVHLLYPRDRRATSKRTSFIDFVIERFGA